MWESGARVPGVNQMYIKCIVEWTKDLYVNPHYQSNLSKTAPVAEWVRSLYFSALNHSIISPLCLV